MDMRSALRALHAAPAFSFLVVGILGLGIGLNTALFTVINAIALQPLPYDRPNELVEIIEASREWGLEAYRGSHAFATVGAYLTRGSAVAGPEGIRNEYGFHVTGNLFALLGVRPLMGRLLTDADEPPGAPRVVVLGYEYWRTRFGTPAALGATLIVDETPHTVVGVMASDFSLFVRDAKLFLPRRVTEGRILARLNPDVPVSAAAAEVERVRPAQRPIPERVVPLDRAFRPNNLSEILLLQGAVLFLLLITCANVANLMLIRGMARTREFAVRAALGASRARMVGQLLTEAAILSIGGGLAGLAFAAALSGWLEKQLPANFSRILRGADGLTIDLRAVLFALLLAVLPLLICGLAPALRTLRRDQAAALRESSQGLGAKKRRTGHWLIAVETGLALVLLASAGLTLKNVVKLQSRDLGFDPGRTLRAHFEISPRRFVTPESRDVAIRQIEEKLRALPGIEEVSLCAPQVFPFGGPAAMPDVFFAGPAYFQTIHIPLLKGRYFQSSDSLHGAPVAILSESEARRRFEGADPLGRIVPLRPTRPDSPTATVVGIVGDVRNPIGLRSQPLTYIPYAQANQTGGVFYIRVSGGDAMTLANSFREAVRAVDPSAPEVGVTSLQKSVDSYINPQRFTASILGFFAALGLLLAAGGIYGVTRFAVAGRIPEIGVRMALGAMPIDVLRLIIGQAALPVACGAVVGIAASLGMQRALGSLLHDVAPHDPQVLAAVGVTILGAALLAAWLPARHGARTDPAVALRHE